MPEKFRWEKGTIEKSVPEKSRGLKTYESMLNFKAESLEGKVVLDLGAGIGAKFAKELKSSGINAQVISVSPDFSDEKHRVLLEPSIYEKLLDVSKLKKYEKPGAVAAIGEQLPFKDESFDEVIALYSTSRYAEVQTPWVLEACRVLKDNGVLRAGPFCLGRLYRPENNELLKTLDDLGYEYEFIETKGFEDTRRFDDNFDDSSEINALILKKTKRHS